MAVSHPPISDLESHLGYWLRRVSNDVSASFARRLDGEGVTVAEWVVLRMLQDVGEVAPGRLAEAMRMTRGAISKLAERLVAKGLVDRLEDPADGRGQILALTAAGRAMVPGLAALADANDAAFFGCLEPAERSELERLLRKIATGMTWTACRRTSPVQPTV
ncbi:MarR family winged helix-turn-helix transcriptional regulator [Methylobrevis pamukkalensis]|uniref:HTH-type transcriptional repressor NicR n=1 Tax=Methylobrevis pamukkalensis TaxID=1439726 RepID=A0A1E3H984_9HYPH|nr:MarR family winged helix-turn-helix transcriptional regulator [Methylobrevis pamukkalensis]ODN72051.1 HTH-type transcriptional repressor NicR [Methylobrevis pamukkalensis]